MRLVTYTLADPVIGARTRVGALIENDVVVDLRSATAAQLSGRRHLGSAYEKAACQVPEDMVHFIKGVDTLDPVDEAIDYVRAEVQRVGVSEARGARRERLCFERHELRLEPPLRPVSIRDTLNFELHMRNGLQRLGLEPPRLWYERPTFYRTSHTNIAGPDDPIVWPSFTEKLDYELEFACIIGRSGVDIAEEEAPGHIFGYTIYNDISCRDVLAEDLSLWVGPAKGKNFRNGNVLGPCIVTADEIDPDNLEMRARCNGEEWSRGNSSDMQFSFHKLVSYLSRDEPIEPGEVIGSGTVGFGCGWEMDRWLQVGDVIELDVEGLGVLSNKVVRQTHAATG